MNRKYLLRTISLVMLAAAVVFVLCALSNPTFGNTFYIGSLKFGAAQWRVCYGIYIIVMTVLFAASFLIKEKKK